jgi:predicted RNA methylase
MSTSANPITLRSTVKKMPGVKRLIDLNVALEDWWFDFYHHVDTSTQIEAQETLGWPEDKVNFHYLPIRPKCARRALRNLALNNRGEYTFIDFGSGKGRMLFLAALHGFRHVCGIELRGELHERALQNFRQCRHLSGCVMESFLMDAAAYELPDKKLVLFFFNPFGSTVMARVLENISASLEQSFRDVWVVLHDPTCAHLADRVPQLKLQAARDGYRIYRSIRVARGR